MAPMDAERRVESVRTVDDGNAGRYIHVERKAHAAVQEKPVDEDKVGPDLPRERGNPAGEPIAGEDAEVRGADGAGAGRRGGDCHPVPHPQERRGEFAGRGLHATLVRREQDGNEQDVGPLVRNGGCGGRIRFPIGRTLRHVEDRISR